jgi:hypothetical protein
MEYKYVDSFPIPKTFGMDWSFARNIVIYDELKKVISAFNRSQIKTILLSGVGLGITVYHHITSRAMSDVDLLIKPEDRQKISWILSELGYLIETTRLSETHYSKTIDSFSFHIDCHTHMRHYLNDNGIKMLWSRARKTKLPQTGIETDVLSPEDALIYTVADSAIYHMEITDNVLSDITQIIRFYQEEINWKEIVGIIKQRHLEAPLYYIFTDVTKKGILIPEEVINAIKPPDRKRRQLFLYKTIINNRKKLDDSIVRFFCFVMCPSARSEIILDSLIPSPLFMKQCYGFTSNFLSYFYYPVRILTLIWRVGKSIFQLCLVISKNLLRNF